MPDTGLGLATPIALRRILTPRRRSSLTCQRLKRACRQGTRQGAGRGAGADGQICKKGTAQAATELLSMVVGGSGGSCAALTFSSSPRALAILATSIRLLRLRRCAEAARSSASLTSAVNRTPTPWPLGLRVRVPTRPLLLLVLFLNIASLSKQRLCRAIGCAAFIAVRKEMAVNVKRH